MKFLSHEERLWQPVRVKSRCEKKFESYCDRFEVKAYLPLKVRLNTVRNKIIKSMVPIFPGYVFACLDHNLRNQIKVSGLVVNYIQMDRNRELSLLEDLRSIVILEKMQAENEELLVEPELKPGKEVEIKSGPFRGLTGVIDRRKGIHRIIVNVEIIGQSVSLETDACDLELEL